ncbi:hypothetical protein Tco_1281591, partial [Tanacetum coccineum]
MSPQEVRNNVSSGGDVISPYEVRNNVSSGGEVMFLKEEEQCLLRSAPSFTSLVLDRRSEVCYTRSRLSGQLMTSSRVVVQYLLLSDGAVFGRSRLSGQLMTSSRAVSDGVVFVRSRLSGQLLTSFGAMVQYLPRSDGTIFSRSKCIHNVMTGEYVSLSFKFSTNRQGEDTSRCLGELATLEEFLNKSLEV